MAFGFLIKIYAYLRERGEPFSILKQGRRGEKRILFVN